MTKLFMSPLNLCKFWFGETMRRRMDKREIDIKIDDNAVVCHFHGKGYSRTGSFSVILQTKFEIH